MQHKVIDLTDEVLAVRHLRAAAMLPRFVSLCLLLGTLLALTLATDNWVLWSSLAISAGGFFVLAHAIDRARAWAVWLLVAFVFALTVLPVMAKLAESLTISRSDLVTIGGLLLVLVPCWILVRLGLTGLRRLPRKIGRNTAIWPHGGWRLPRDDRLRTASGTFIAALFIYIAGAIPALLIGIMAGGHLLVAGVAYLPVAYFAGRLWDRGRRQLALRVQEIRKLDTRAPVLLLRSFSEDNLALERRYRMLWILEGSKQTFTLESYVVNRVWYLGPVIAVGDPRDDLSPLGAARDYVPEDQWRARISEYLDESVYVVCILGSTPGLRWEYEEIKARGKQDNVLVVFPPKPIEELQRRWVVFRDIFDRAADIDFSSDSRHGVPLLALFSSSDAPSLILICRYNNETAYEWAFSTLFEKLQLPGHKSDAARPPTIFD